MIIRKLQLSDLHALSALDKVSFDKAWSPQALSEELAHPDALNLGVFAPELRSALLTRMVAGERWIFRIMTHPEFRRQQLAEQLLALLPKEPLWLEVNVLNTSAISFYEKMGFEIVATRPGYYPEDALVMKHA
ncbi:MAG: GNAT family N-acetyltransferase [Myxococcota bacterium]